VSKIPDVREASGWQSGFLVVMGLRVVLAGLGIVASACGGVAGSAAQHAGSATEPSPPPVTVEQVPPGEREGTPSALDNPSDDRFPPPVIDVGELRPGGPPPDGIPAIDEPRFLDAGGVAFLDDNEPVLALEIDGDARAYPLQIMTWHEIANDTVSGVPVAVTYCPLCNTAIAFDRRLDDRVLSFGTSGMLYHSALVMYDRQTESLWSHFTSEALVGVLAGQQLHTFPVAIVSWSDWRDAHPDGLVLSRETGHGRDYGVNPYPGYDDVDTPPFLFDGEVDGRLAAKERIVGIGLDRDPVAVRLDALTEAGVLTVDVDGTPLTVWHLPGTASALDAQVVSEGRDVGATGVFVPEVDGQTLTFELHDDGDRLVDAETGSEWDIFGEAFAGSLTGERLEAVEHVDTFWFAWAAYQPDTRIEPA
jgi:Protein of unknown function (DUF3179)